MLEHSDIHPTIPATDLSRARTWYADKLGLSPDAEFPGAVSYRVGDSGGFLLFSAAAAGTTEHQVATWIVQDVAAEVAELRSRGVVFEEHDRPGLRTVDGIATTPAGRGAWFKDSEGNVLTMMQLAELGPDGCFADAGLRRRRGGHSWRAVPPGGERP